LLLSEPHLPTGQYTTMTGITHQTLIIEALKKEKKEAPV
jgi:hypothetical protein